ncbi:hypothetical protein A6R68_24106, partial [Neotoma lepida]
KEKKDEKAMNHMMEDLDTNKDGEVSFDEYVGLITEAKQSSRVSETLSMGNATSQKDWEGDKGED